MKTSNNRSRVFEITMEGWREGRNGKVQGEEVLLGRLESFGALVMLKKHSVNID